MAVRMLSEVQSTVRIWTYVATQVGARGFSCAVSGFGQYVACTNAEFLLCKIVPCERYLQLWIAPTLTKT